MVHRIEAVLLRSLRHSSPIFTISNLDRRENAVIGQQAAESIDAPIWPQHCSEKGTRGGYGFNGRPPIRLGIVGFYCGENAARATAANGVNTPIWPQRCSEKGTRGGHGFNSRPLI